MDGIDPSRTVVVVLGARVFPKFPALSGGRKFARSVDELLSYLTGSRGLGINDRDVLDLFDDNRPAADQLGEIAQFLSAKQNAPGSGVENVFLYYVGHGLFTPSDMRYCLAIRCTNVDTVGISAMRGRDLAEVISTHATHLRRFLILEGSGMAHLLRLFAELTVAI